MGPDSRRLEELGLNSSTPPGQLLYDGWLLRMLPGKAKRARSVNAVYPSTLALERKIDALAFAVTGPSTNEWDQPYGAKTKDLVTPTQRRELGGLGIEIGSHSRTHCEMPLLAGDELTTEASGSLEDLRAGGLNPRFFAYPYGTRNASSKKAVADAGYCAAFGTAHRRVRRSDDRFDLPRVMIHATDRGWRFRTKTAAPRIWGSIERIRRTFSAAARRMTP